MKICFDANIIVDMFLKSKWLAETIASYDIATLNDFDVCVSASSLSDIEYVARQRGLSREQTHECMGRMFHLFDVLDLNGTDGVRAHENKMKDYEDALIAESCHRNNVDLILTRDKKDFKNSPVPSMDPDTFIETYKPANYNFELVDF